ncbi:Gustatory receptor 30 [Frankliniella occidentalis]|nr:Gustatory receptor 30 [Frankliniella occidentalis]
MPASCLLYMLNSMAFTTFMAYQTTVGIRARNMVVIGNMVGYCVTWLITLFFVCYGADKATEMVKHTLLDVLLRGAGAQRWSFEVYRELKFFTRIVRGSNIAVSMAGFFELNKRFYSSVLTAVITYVVVLLQFQQIEEKSLKTLREDPL